MAVWRGGPGGKAGQVERREKMVEALNLRKTGMSYNEIAKRIGFETHSAAYKLVQQALDELPREPAEELRQLELERLDLITFSLMKKVLKGDHNAANSVLRAMERRARLTGLDEIEVSDGGMELAMKQYERLVQAIQGTADDEDHPGDH